MAPLASSLQSYHSCHLLRQNKDTLLNLYHIPLIIVPLSRVDMPSQDPTITYDDHEESSAFNEEGLARAPAALQTILSQQSKVLLPKSIKSTNTWSNNYGPTQSGSQRSTPASPISASAVEIVNNHLPATLAIREVQASGPREEESDAREETDEAMRQELSKTAGTAQASERRREGLISIATARRNPAHNHTDIQEEKPRTGNRDFDVAMSTIGSV